MPDLPAKPDPLQPQRPKLTSNRKLTELTVDEMVRVSVAFSRSQTFKNKGNSMTPEEIFVIILAGQELGLGPSQAVMGIKMIEGKPELSANTMAALVKSSGKYDYRAEWGTDDDKWCQVTFFSITDGSIVGVSKFTPEMADAAGLRKPARSGAPSNYEKYWRNMFFARALSNGVKWFTPDALMVTAYHEGETEGDTEAPPPSLPVGPAQATIAPAQPEIAAPPAEDAEKVPVVAGAEPYDRDDDEESIDAEDVEVQQVGLKVEGPAAGEMLPGESATQAMERMISEEHPGDLENPFAFDPVTEPPPKVVPPPSTLPPTVVSDEHYRKATPAQIKLLRFRVNDAGLTEERWKQILFDETGVHHTDKTPFDAVNPLLERLEAEKQLKN